MPRFNKQLLRGRHHDAVEFLKKITVVVFLLNQLMNNNNYVMLHCVLNPLIFISGALHTPSPSLSRMPFSYTIMTPPVTNDPVYLWNVFLEHLTTFPVFCCPCPEF